MNILIGADIMPGEKYANFEIQSLLTQELRDLLSLAAYRVFNLESPITNSSTPISKFGINTRTSPIFSERIKELEVDLLTLANNHIMDYGVKGLTSTVQLLDKHGIEYVGAGSDLISASKPYYTNVGGGNIWILCMHGA